MNREEVRARIEEIGIIPAIRVSSPEDALLAAEAVASGGIPIVEVTMTVPDAAGVIASLTKQRPELIIGAGTVLDVETAVRCLDAGANFLTSPGLDLDIVEFAHRRDTVVFPGALTPSEVMAARKAGCDFVKIFPCSQLGGPSYIKALKAPFPKVPLIASGGVNERNIVDFILAGAAAVGVGGHLIPRRAIELRQPHRIHELAARFVKALKAARSQVTEG
ncbi:MAG: bifunctional 4-hydroxy-2-oxoglutarate aldolase/2-dehydro-3-deoxy-phosphogluconate aldolase [Bryobacteraceae bacterium]|jgi:2-dehydro-3-deoxyphosphogluconate aldolase/(4S)-4-hydroxy-2-oxoglutarate aldolase